MINWEDKDIKLTADGQDLSPLPEDLMDAIAYNIITSNGFFELFPDIGSDVIDNMETLTTDTHEVENQIWRDLRDAGIKINRKYISVTGDSITIILDIGITMKITNTDITVIKGGASDSDYYVASSRALSNKYLKRR